MKKYNNNNILTGELKRCKHCGNPKRFHHKDTERLVCRYCGHFVYKNDEIENEYKKKEFKQRLKCFLI